MANWSEEHEKRIAELEEKVDLIHSKLQLIRELLERWITDLGKK